MKTWQFSKIEGTSQENINIIFFECENQETQTSLFSLLSSFLLKLRRHIADVRQESSDTI